MWLLVCSWFHGKISRDRAEQLLSPKEDGLFLVRESTNFPGDYTLCVCYQGKVEHYRVKYKDNQLTIDDEEFFENLSQLVEVQKLAFVATMCVNLKYTAYMF
jgi:c-src tyrosine kinase